MEDHIKKYQKSDFVDEAKVGLMEGYRNPATQFWANSQNIQSINLTPNTHYVSVQDDNYNLYQPDEDSITKKTNIWVICFFTISIYAILAYILLVYK